MSEGSKTPAILIVDDDENIRQLLTLMFQSRGLENVQSAANGNEGFEKLKTYTEPCIVFLDLMMPVCSGWEFLEKLEAHPELKQHSVAVMSASRPDREGLYSQYFFQKPLEIAKVFEFIDTQLKKS